MIYDVLTKHLTAMNGRFLTDYKIKMDVLKYERTL